MSQNFDAVAIFANSFSDLVNLTSILPYYDVDPKKIQYIGNSTWGKELILKDPSLNGAYFTSLDIEEKSIFDREYKNIFNKDPHSLAIFVYDVVGLISSLSLKHSIITKEMLHSNTGYIGLSGWFRFEENGKVSRIPNILHIHNNKFVVKTINSNF